MNSGHTDKVKANLGEKNKEDLLQACIQSHNVPVLPNFCKQSTPSCSANIEENIPESSKFVDTDKLVVNVRKDLSKAMKKGNTTAVIDILLMHKIDGDTASVLLESAQPVTTAGASTKAKRDVRKSNLVSSERKRKTVISRVAEMTGPMARLRHFMEHNIRVKVWTRSFKHVRGVLSAYIVMFDKHWNLALMDVEEVYLENIFKPVTSDVILATSESNSKELMKQELKRRFVAQLFVRGDNVVSISPIEKIIESGSG